ncbi:MAG TPA: DMT family transporter [Geodermatophilus sp.]|nr:DMT family transporter [Geodermatophilus sp.]
MTDVLTAGGDGSLGLGAYLPGTVLALLAAVLFGLGSVLQHEAAAAAATDGRPSMRAMVRRRGWLVGQGVTATGSGAQVAALALAPVSIVQPLLVGALVAALVARTVRTGRRPTRDELSGAALTVGGLVVFVVAARPTQAAVVTPPSAWATAAAVTAVTLAVALTARLGAGSAAALACGVAGGLAAGVSAVLVSAAAAVVQDDGPAGALAGAVLWGAALTAIASQVGAQQAYGRGSLSWSLPALVVADPLTAVPAARFLLGEHLEPGAALVWGPAGVVAVLGVVLLSRSGDRPPQRTAPAAGT